MSETCRDEEHRIEDSRMKSQHQNNFYITNSFRTRGTSSSSKVGREIRHHETGEAHRCSASAPLETYTTTEKKNGETSLYGTVRIIDPNSGCASGNPRNTDRTLNSSRKPGKEGKSLRKLSVKSASCLARADCSFNCCATWFLLKDTS